MPASVNKSSCSTSCLNFRDATDEEGQEAERLRLYDIQWLDEPSIAQARIGEEHLIKKHEGLSEDIVSSWVAKHADAEEIQVNFALSTLP